MTVAVANPDSKIFLNWIGNHFVTNGNTGDGRWLK